MESTSGRDDAPRVVYLARNAEEVARRYRGRLRRMRDEGFAVHILTAIGPGMQQLLDEGFEVQPIPVGNPGNLAGLLGTYFIVQAHLIENPAVLVHSFGHRLAWLGTYAARQVEVPAVFSTLEYHWLEDDPLHFPLGPVAQFGVPKAVQGLEEGLNRAVGPVHRRWMRQAYRWLGRQVDRYVVTTEFDFQLVQDMELVPVEKLEIAVGATGVDLERYCLPEKGDADREGARRALGLPQHWRQVAGWVGPVTRRHGADDLIEVIDRLSHSHPSVGWLVNPRGQIAAGQRRRLNQLEGKGRVYLLDEPDDDVEAYRAMDLLVWPGRPSTPHDAIAEAAALAVPTVGFDTPAARSIVEPGQTGHLVFADEIEALSITVAKLLTDPAYLRELGWRARSRINLHFSRHDVDRQILRLYDRVLDQKLRAE